VTTEYYLAKSSNKD